MYVCKRSKTCGEKIALLNSVVPSFTLPHYTHFGRTRKRVLYTVYLYYVSIFTKPISAHIYICDRTYRNLLFFPFPVYGKWCGGVLGQLFFFSSTTKWQHKITSNWKTYTQSVWKVWTFNRPPYQIEINLSSVGRYFEEKLPICFGQAHAFHAVYQ